VKLKRPMELSFREKLPGFTGAVQAIIIMRVLDLQVRGFIARYKHP
jgi:hypothetical protein